MTAIHQPLPDKKLIEPLFRAIKHVFETNLIRRTNMVGICTPEQLAEHLHDRDSEFVISVIKCSGDCACNISIVSPNPLNFIFARDFLDVDESMLQLGAEIPVYRDAAGELNNMLAGSFRNMLSKGQMELHLTPPFIVDGHKSLIASMLKASSVLIAEIKVEEFSVHVCLWT
jgi:CheY-specific phosphatase CheX